jgi:hypothetical protein
MTTNFFLTPLFCCCFWIRDPRSGIRDKHPGSATLGNMIRVVFYPSRIQVQGLKRHWIPDPQQWFLFVGKLFGRRCSDCGEREGGSEGENPCCPEVSAGLGCGGGQERGGPADIQNAGQHLLPQQSSCFYWAHCCQVEWNYFFQYLQHAGTHGACVPRVVLILLAVWSASGCHLFNSGLDLCSAYHLSLRQLDLHIG